MTESQGRPRRVTRVIAAASVALTASVLAIVAVAGHDAGTSYTGCLDEGVNKGKIYRLAPGDAPAAPCNKGDIQVYLGAGDITAVIAGTGLEGGASSGDATLAISSGYRLPQGCFDGEVAEKAGGGWTCAVDDDTTYTAGTGLDLSGTIFHVKPEFRLPQICEPGDLTAWNGFQWTCVPPSVEKGLVAILDAGSAVAIGSTDTDLCDEGQNESGDSGPFSFTSNTVHLEPGDYLAVPDSLRWSIRKNSGSGAWDDADVFYAGRVSATLGVGARFDRNVNSRGLIAEPDRDFGVFTISHPDGADVSLTIEAYAWACSAADIRGSVAIIRL